MSPYGYMLTTLIGILVIVGVYAYSSPEGILVANDPAIAAEDIASLDEVDLPNLGPAPALTGIVDWINSEPISSEQLKGKVVLVDFWTYSCINCIRTLPYLQSWHAKYKDQGFVMLGVHTPEFDFEKKRSNIVAAAAEYGITYPIAMDSDYATWNAYRNRYWPAHYLQDVEGNIRFVHFGEGKYVETEQAIRQLLLEGGLLSEAEAAASVAESQRNPADRAESQRNPADRAESQRNTPGSVEIEEPQTRQVGTPEIYFGSARLEYLGNVPTGLSAGTPAQFSVPAIKMNNIFYLEGEWQIDTEAAELVSDTGRIVLSYTAADVHLVLAVEDTEVVVEVKLDGEYLTDENKGSDVFIEDGRSFIKVSASRKYTLVSEPDSGRHSIELQVQGAGLEAFAFTFG